MTIPKLSVIAFTLIASAIPATAQDVGKGGAFGVATDKQGSAWIVNDETGSVRFCRPNGSTLLCSDWSRPVVSGDDAAPGVIAATISVNCGANTYELTTGTDQGACNTDTKPGGNTGGSCGKDGKNTANVSCNSSGSGACSATGSGKCTEQKN